MNTNKNGEVTTGRERLDTTELNKGTAFTAAERDEYGLRGLLPSVTNSQEVQLIRSLENLRHKDCNIER